VEVETVWVVEIGVETERVAPLPSPLTRALMDLFQTLVGASLGILVNAAREDPADSTVGSAL